MGEVRKTVVYRDAGIFHRFMRKVAANNFASTALTRTLPATDRLVYRLTRGRRTWTNLVSGLPVVTLTTTGAASGIPRTTMVLAIPDGENIAAIASNYGKPVNPGWCANLRKNPDAKVTESRTVRRVRADEVHGLERERIWETAMAVFPGFAAYERKAHPRLIPVFVLTPIEADSPSAHEQA